MNWISVKDKLPVNGQAVLVCYCGGNWSSEHTLSDGETYREWKWQVAKFVLGRSAEEVANTGIIRSEDQYGNNLVPYIWDEFGPGQLFGQDVSHWCAIDPVASSKE